MVLSCVRRLACLDRGIGDLMGQNRVVVHTRLRGRGPAMGDGIKHDMGDGWGL